MVAAPAAAPQPHSHCCPRSHSCSWGVVLLLAFILASPHWPCLCWLALLRVFHEYGNTCGVSKTGTTGMGMVVDFGTPQHTTTRTRGVAGIHGLNIYQRRICLFIIFVVISYQLFNILRYNFQVEFKTPLNSSNHCMAVRHAYFPASCLLFHFHHHHKSMQSM